MDTQRMREIRYIDRLCDALRATSALLGASDVIPEVLERRKELNQELIALVEDFVAKKEGARYGVALGDAQGDEVNDAIVYMMKLSAEGNSGQASIRQMEEKFGGTSMRRFEQGSTGRRIESLRHKRSIYLGAVALVSVVLVGRVVV